MSNNLFQNLYLASRRVVLCAVLAIAALSLTASGDGVLDVAVQQDKFRELIVGTWQGDTPHQILTFSKDGSYSQEPSEYPSGSWTRHWSIEGNKLTSEATIVYMKENELGLGQKGAVLHRVMNKTADHQ